MSKQEEVLMNQNVAPEQFDWDSFESGLNAEDRKEKNELEEIYKGSLNDLSESDVIIGKVVRLTDKEAIVDINFKSEGVISLNEFRYNSGLKVGDEVEVMVDRREDKTGQLQLSHKKARTLKAWDKVNEYHQSGEIVNGFVKSRTKGGMIVDVFGIEAFLPGSQIDVKPIKDYDQFVGKTMEFKVVKINPEFKNVVVSHKALIEADIEGQKKEIISQLEKGQVLEGTVKNITSYGVFIDLGGEGLIHVSEMSWSTHLRSAGDFVKIGDEVEAVVLTLDKDERKISLGIKQLTPDPWADIQSKYPVGSKHTGTVRNFTNFGVFVELEEGIDGLIYISDLSWTKKIKHPSEFCAVGDKLDVVVLELDTEARRLSLGHKQLTENPWDKYESKYAEGTVHTGTAVDVFDKGAQVQFEDAEVEAFCPSRLLEKEDGSKIKKGEEAQFKVIEFNKEFKRVVVSHTGLFRDEEKKNVKEAAAKSSSNEERTTLGDIDALAELKKKMEGGK